MRPATRRKLRFAAAFAVYFTALWALWDTPLVYPLKVFVVLLHELSHAAVAVATGGSIERIVLDPAQGGACYCPDGNAFLTLSAGYLGSLAWGGVLLTAAQSRRLDARWVTALVGAAVVVLTALYVRNAFGLAFGLAFGGALLLAARRLPGHVNQVLVTVLGLT
ncbi:MAG: M50 family peptidase, partial [Gemmatimonadetes bacterium]